MTFRNLLRAGVFAAFVAPALAHAVDTKTAAAPPPFAPAPMPDRPTHFVGTAVATDGSVSIGGKAIAYTAVVGTIVVHPKGYDDVSQDAPAGAGADDKPPPTEAAMSYVAYIKKGEAPESRPVMFLYNGGPGSSTVWLHMGAFGPRRVVTADDTHTPPAPYQLVNNGQSLLDATDLVFIDAPGTGFGRIAGGDGKDKEFRGVDQDAHAFADFIQSFLAQYGRWNSPKYLFGESYGTTRSAVLSFLLTNDYNIDLNGVVLLSQVLNFDAIHDEGNPGTDFSHELFLPTFTAVAWYHHKLPPEANAPTDASGLKAYLGQVEHFALGDYAAALAAGTSLDSGARDAIASKLHLYTGLSVEYIKKADLRVTAGEFEKMLQDDTGDTTGRLDARFSGPSLDPLSKEADYDPQSASIASAYVATFNDYVRRTLHYGAGQTFLAEHFGGGWDWKHQQPGQDQPSDGAANVMVDLAAALKTNPLLQVQLDQGYFDLATPYFEGVFEMQHLPMEAKLMGNIEIKQYLSGHMVYAHQDSLQQLHDNVAGFIARTHGAAPAPAAP